MTRKTDSPYIIIKFISEGQLRIIFLQFKMIRDQQIFKLLREGDLDSFQQSSSE